MKPLYKVTFHNAGRIYELYARKVASGALWGFTEVSELVFDVHDGMVIDPTEERLRDEFAGYFQRYDVLLAPVTPFPATKHGLDDVIVDGKAWSPFQVMNGTSPFSLTGLPAMTLRFGTSRDGLPIGVQIVSSWYAELTMFDVALRLEAMRPVRNLHPAL